MTDVPESAIFSVPAMIGAFIDPDDLGAALARFEELTDPRSGG
jgi:hypothetical protein